MIEKARKRRRVEFNGEVDAWGFDTALCDKSPEIGGVNVIGRLEETFGSKWGSDRPDVTVYLGVEPLKTGPLWTLYGFGGTDVTPPESPEITVGDWDLIDKLRELDGREVALVVEDTEPINLGGARYTTQRPGEKPSDAMNRLTEGWDL